MARKAAPASPPPSPLTPTPTATFKKDVKRQEKRSKDLGKLRAVLATLCARRPLDPKHKDHALGGEWRGWRDCHIEPDWVLIYKVDGGELKLGRTGTHADLFE
jgi:mRNA interferase YafQ